MTSAPPSPPPVRLPFALAIVAGPFVLFLYPLVVALAARSEYPAVLGRWSWSAAAFIALSLLLLACFAVVLARRRWREVAVAITALIAVSYIAAASSSIQNAWAMIGVLTAMRLMAVISLAVIALISAHEGRPRTSLVSLACAAVLLVPSVVDLVWSFVPETDEHRIWNQYRVTYDMTGLTPRDIAIVGDSYVWGAGVPVEKRFGNVLERKLGGAHVYSLGQVGANLKSYTGYVRDVPARPGARRVVIAFFMNDMPPTDRLDRYMEWLATSAGKTSISARLALDLLRLSFAPDVDGYVRQLLEDFDDSRPDFPARWQLLTDQLAELHRLAVERSPETPVLLLLPALSDFGRERWQAIHQRLARTGESVGFQVLDLFGDLEVGRPQALALRAAPNDLHFNERANEIVAQRLFELLSAK